MRKVNNFKMHSKSKITNYIKQEIVLCIAAVLAIISMFFVFPDKKYIEYIDFRTLGILFSLMAVMEGFKEINAFKYLAQKMLVKVKKVRQLIMILSMLCFFLSMLITNDVALITFVPLTIIILNMLGEEYKRKYLIPIVVIQTVAANLGSMLTPIGNPQNLYLYGISGMKIADFLWLMLPYTMISLVCILVWICMVSRRQNKAIKVHIETEKIKSTRDFIIYLILFLVCLLCVARLIDYRVLMIIIFITVFTIDRRILKQVDYSLLLTFVAFFVFIGNMGRVDAFRNFLENIIVNNEVITSVVSSQVISNVPAALLLSGFTNDYKSLIIGTNIGGLGTLIASMASLISFKYIAKEFDVNKGKYVLYFTLSNIIILIILLAFEILN